MEYCFKNKHAADLYNTGRSRKYKLQAGILKKFFMRVQQIEAAEDIYDLWKTPSLNFEKMQGYENKFSIRIDDKWRLDLSIDWKNEEKTKGILNIIELSKHYGD